MRVLLTGAGGFLGQQLYKPILEAGHQVLLTDIQPVRNDQPSSIGDLADPEFVSDLVKGVDAIVIAHMAARNEQSPSSVFSAMGHGTLNLFQAAVNEGVRDICLVSSVDTVLGYPENLPRTRDLHPRAVDLYGFSKALQENVAQHYARCADLNVSVLRIGYVMDVDTLTNKYGVVEPTLTENMIDRRDVGHVCERMLGLHRPGCHVYYVTAATSHSRFDTQPTWEAIGWKPQHLADPSQVSIRKSRPSSRSIAAY